MSSILNQRFIGILVSDWLECVNEFVWLQRGWWRQRLGWGLLFFQLEGVSTLLQLIGKARPFQPLGLVKFEGSI
jgi:hypothetical protein